MITSDLGLLGCVGIKQWDAIVVEGYDGVGKGKVLRELSQYYNMIPYRPDYNLWQRHDVRKTDRWKMSGFFWDIYSHFDLHSSSPLLFDRGCISGAVYADDPSIADDYKSLLRDMKVLHILVYCSDEDYIKFQTSRNPNISTTELYRLLDEKILYTNRYKEYLNRAGVDWIVYQNKFDEEESRILSKTCAGCGHYNYGICRHPIINRAVKSGAPRCSLSYDKETQDVEVILDGPEMQCV